MNNLVKIVKFFSSITPGPVEIQNATLQFFLQTTLSLFAIKQRPQIIFY